MRPLTPSGLGLALMLVLATMQTPAVAQTGDEILLLDLCVNERCLGIAAVVLRGEQILVDRAALDAAGLDSAGVPGERIGEREFVPASKINHGTEIAVDRAQLRLDVRQRAQDRPRQQIDLRTRPAMDTAPQPWTAFVNYAVNLGRTSVERSVFFDGAAGRGHAALRSTALWSGAEGWQRGLTRFELDQPQYLRRWTLGDQFAIARDPLGGGALLGGFGVERAFDQDPYLVTFPQPFYSGVLEQPGTVEIYANGALIARRELGAGPFTFQNLGIPPGRSDVQIVVRDPFGNRSALSGASYYGTNTLLTKGLSEYAVRLGAPRTAGGLGGGYGEDIAVQAWYRRGVSDWLTLGARLEGDETFANAGADASLRLPFGEIGLAVAAGKDQAAGHGRAGSLSYSYGGRRSGVAFGTRRFDAAYRNLGQPFLLFGGRLREDDYVNLSFSPHARLSLQLNAGRQRRETLPVERTAGLTGTLRLSPRAQLLLAVQRRESDAVRDTQSLLSLNVAFDRDNLSVSARRDSGGTGYGFDARRSRPSGPGWGYDLSLQRHDAFGNTGFGQVEYEGRHGRYAAIAERFGDRTQGRVLLSGALVGIGGRAYFTPPLESGFALVRVPALSGVTVLRENRAIGRLDARGDLLVRDLIPYYANKLALDAAEVPVDYDIKVGAREVAVPRNTGALVGFDVDALHAVTGHVLLRAATGVAPAVHGLLRLSGEDGGTVETMLGGNGRFYLEDLPPGRYRVEAESGGALARCALQVPATRSGVTDLGNLVCAVGEGE